MAPSVKGPSASKLIILIFMITLLSTVAGFF